jgi:hypothetical protein
MIVQRFRDLVAEIGNFLGLTVKRQGIYIIMYINSGIYMQEVQGGFMCERGVFSWGFKEDCQDT